MLANPSSCSSKTVSTQGHSWVGEQKETVTSPRRLPTGYLYTASDETWVKRGNGSRREDLGLRRHFPVHTGLRASRL